MPRIPTPIPTSVWVGIKSIFRGALPKILWRLFVLGLGVAVIVLLLSISTGFFIAFLVGTVLSIAFSDNIRMLVLDIWYGRFLSISV